ncbi:MULTISPECIES: cytochrome P450 [Streptomyces]|uniref:Cytochrome P450 n=1 Tax=Streptomyces tsukubensis (strain DSM 42081 / NBRC 108919 / NRRL 18488 / 9993) TaxID=1114943 RepID=I2MXM3_STRT9|nr:MULTISPECIES: cytochrome P450 [Streptomyces]AZK93887.1 steroid C27-monooxygenase [Streptomyces tsukubensis]EIF89520.1 cytochrome P450 [Streptomyces tsukubensis NRRL18488]MYS64237.1 cytochrome P450 [Streptomyces sp. SID5473]QKM69985.1 cytochrome P450 [Streptomyces tsukubensis NRRL18488]TAI46038.1 cytochrome P450 [Streptomyces tsukubensis]
MAPVPCPHLPEGFDVTDPDLLQSRVPHPEFALLRRVAPVSWCAQRHGVSGFDDDGYWAVTRHADVKYVSTRPELFSSWTNTAVIRFNESIRREQIDVQRLIMLNMDPPEHTRVRQIVQRGFTPRAVNSLRTALRERALKIVDEAVARSRDGGSFDFVSSIAVELPLQAIAELIGVPQEDRSQIFDWSNTMASYDDPEFAVTEEAGIRASMDFLSYAMNLAAARKECPAQDIVTQLVAAGDAGNLSNDEFGFFVILLAVAGNETTRNAITHGMHAFLSHPEQWELYRRERPATTAEEIVRWATPIVSFQRTATQDVELGGQRIRKGDRVGLFYSSANNDPEVFEDPEAFDITRDPNPHLGFGGGGPHFCLGKSLAVMEIDLIFNAIADALPGLKLAGEPRRLRSAWLNGVKELRVTTGA